MVAKVLIDSFAASGQICAVVAPAKDEELVKSVVATAVNADVVILDWQIGKYNGSAAINLIKQISESDNKHGGRLRLIVIYTGEPQVQTCFDAVKQSVPELKEESNGQFVLAHQKLRVVFFKKTDGTDIGTGAVRTRELPGRIVSEFAAFTTWRVIA